MYTFTVRTFLAGLCALIHLSGCATVRQQLGTALISDEAEYALGEQVAAQIDSTQKALRMPTVQRYVERVAAPLIENALVDRPGVQYRLTVLDDASQINAFAAPGGFIYVYTGLLIAADDEAELAGVLAHEIGHIVGRHSANQLASQYGIQVLTSIALGQEADAAAGQIANIASQLGSARFSRDDERQADRYGVRYTTASGYDPAGLLSFFEKLKAAEGGRRSSVEKLLSSHPATDDRIRTIQALIERNGTSGGERNRERFMRETAPLHR